MVDINYPYFGGSFSNQKIKEYNLDKLIYEEITVYDLLNLKGILNNVLKFIQKNLEKVKELRDAAQKFTNPDPVSIRNKAHELITEADCEVLEQ